ncbi:hypothetical protein BDV95DRAFT_391478 [Massariosphaeria phaeospora]|uniref:Uncharacterized protein n=1 Tax=Massariosphaeria phaeospora TaxID=100035 RepID=A0A7C8I7K2_9PLEO|nr:hypothetical protein BDV95DRAFT_391478 [Massariosphaeria phaeospora]
MDLELERRRKVRLWILGLCVDRDVGVSRSYTVDRLIGQAECFEVAWLIFCAAIIDGFLVERVKTSRSWVVWRSLLYGWCVRTLRPGASYFVRLKPAFICRRAAFVEVSLMITYLAFGIILLAFGLTCWLKI